MKNSDPSELPYVILHGKKGPVARSCPRCGHIEKRQERQLCSGCRRFVATDECRQSWTSLPKNTYSELPEVYLGGPRDTPGKEFSRSRRSFGWQVASRNLCLSFMAAAVLVVPAVLGAKAYMGEKQWGQVEKGIENNFKKIARDLEKSLATASGAQPRRSRATRV